MAVGHSVAVDDGSNVVTVGVGRDKVSAVAGENVTVAVMVVVGDGGKDVGVLVGWLMGVVVATAVVAVAADIATVGVTIVSDSGAQAASDSKRKQ